MGRGELGGESMGHRELGPGEDTRMAQGGKRGRSWGHQGKVGRAGSEGRGGKRETVREGRSRWLRARQAGGRGRRGREVGGAS